MTPCRFLSLLIALALPGVAAAKPPEQRDLDDAVAKAMKAWPVPGAAVVIVQDGKVVYLKVKPPRHQVKQAHKTVKPSTTQSKKASKVPAA